MCVRNNNRVNPDTNRHLTGLPASIYSHKHTLPQRAPGRGESSSSSEVERKPIGQIRFRCFLTELSINLQHCAMICRDLGLSQHSVWECSKSLLIRPGGHGAYDDITQPLSFCTHPSLSQCVHFPICPLLFPSLLLSFRVRRCHQIGAQIDAYLT